MEGEVSSERKRDATNSSVVLGQYEVFLSFCGKDTRNGFTDFLYTRLVGTGVRTFRDDNVLRVGKEIGSDLLKSINQSKILIPIFSRNYAYSKWCMLELAQMVASHKREGMIFPIFYDVVPSDVRHQIGKYEDAFVKHEKNFNGNIIQEWKEALSYVGQLKGYELAKETNGREGQLVEKVVREVLLKLKKNYTRVHDNLVGMADHVKEMMELVNVLFEGVLVVGVHGMGGIGKTTIAKVIYDQLFEDFDYCCFIEDVRARVNEGHNGRVNLQEQLVCTISQLEVVKLKDADDGVYRIKDAVYGRRCLIVLDDVDEKSHFDKLLGECDGFGTGSRIIITTRNRDILRDIELTYEAKNVPYVCRSYEPDLMDPVHSLQLFTKHAFMRDHPPEDYFILSKKVVSTAGGLPLVLVTLGSLFFGKKDKDLWNEKLRELEQIPHEDVLKKLRISFEVLNNTEKKIFLDIACLFIGEDKINPFYMWDICNFYPRNGVYTLVVRSLLKVGDDGRLLMHDQLRDMGRQIVREENMSEPGGRSRLWHNDEAFDILEECTGTKNVEALCLDLRSELTDMLEYDTHRLSAEAFEQIPNVRFLRAGTVELYGDCKNQFSKLRWLSWSCVGKSTPTNLHLKNLIILDLSNSNIDDGWKGWGEIKMAKKLQVLDLSHCNWVTRAPNLSLFPILERLNLTHCLGLKKIDPSIGNLTNLRVLDLSNCMSLVYVDCSIFRNLKSLDLHCCKGLLQVCGIENLICMTYLDTSSCHSLIMIDGLGELQSLETLNMFGCNSIEGVLNLFNFTKLRTLNLSCCENLLEIEVLGLDSLECLNLHGCKHLERLGDLSCSKLLKELDVTGCNKLVLTQGLESLEHVISKEILELMNMNYRKHLCSNLSKMVRFLVATVRWLRRSRKSIAKTNKKANAWMNDYNFMQEDFFPTPKTTTKATDVAWMNDFYFMQEDFFPTPKTTTKATDVAWMNDFYFMQEDFFPTPKTTTKATDVAWMNDFYFMQEDFFPTPKTTTKATDVAWMNDFYFMQEDFFPTPKTTTKATDVIGLRFSILIGEGE